MLPERTLDALRRFHALGGVVVGPRPGSNLLPELCASLDERPSLPGVDGEEMESLYRAGLLSVAPYADSYVLPETEEFGGIEADHLWVVTPEGLAFLKSTESQEKAGA